MLVEFGVPFKIAMALDNLERVGMLIMAGEIRGAKFDWGLMKFEDPDQR